MNFVRTFNTAVFILLIILGLAFGLAQEEQAGHSHARAKIHGGDVVMTRHHHFEVLPARSGLLIFVYDSQQTPLYDLTDITGNTILLLKSGEEIEFDLTPVHLPGDGSGDRKGVHRHGMMNESHQPEMTPDEEHSQREMMQGEDPQPARRETDASSYLFGEYDCKSLEAESAKAVIHLRGLDSSGEPKVKFRETLNLKNLRSLQSILRSGTEDDRNHHHE